MPTLLVWDPMETYWREARLGLMDRIISDFLTESVPEHTQLTHLSLAVKEQNKNPTVKSHSGIY